MSSLLNQHSLHAPVLLAMLPLGYQCRHGAGSTAQYPERPGHPGGKPSCSGAPGEAAQAAHVRVNAAGWGWRRRQRGAAAQDGCALTKPPAGP